MTDLILGNHLGVGISACLTGEAYTSEKGCMQPPHMQLIHRYLTEKPLELDLGLHVLRACISTYNLKNKKTTQMNNCETLCSS